MFIRLAVVTLIVSVPLLFIFFTSTQVAILTGIYIAVVTAVATVQRCGFKTILARAQRLFHKGY
jgi:hypothetical protein